jgi:hypothetical protein
MAKVKVPETPGERLKLAKIIRIVEKHIGRP